MMQRVGLGKKGSAFNQKYVIFWLKAPQRYWQNQTKMNDWTCLENDWKKPRNL